jgi:hypothetical protein
MRKATSSAGHHERVSQSWRPQLVELHDNFAISATWRRFVASGKPVPDARGDSDYESKERLVAHVQASARSYLLWIWEVLEQPIEGLPLIRDPEVIVPRLDAFMEETLDGWRRHLAPLENEQCSPKTYLSRWVERPRSSRCWERWYPMRHRIQLERILAG